MDTFLLTELAVQAPHIPNDSLLCNRQGWDNLHSALVPADYKTEPQHTFLIDWLKCEVFC